MYLSRLQLNPTSRTLWRSVVDQPYRLHQLVMQGFPDGVDRQSAHVLHRLDQTHSGLMLLVQSDIQPDWQSLDPELLLPPDPFDPLPNPAIQTLADLRLENGRILQFRLVANPTIKKVRRDDNGKRQNSNRVPLVREEEQVKWLAAKGEQHGFRLLHVTISGQTQQKGWKKGAPPLTLYTVQFDGRLQITDRDKFITAVQTGIGPAKAFGCGLLSLAPG